MSDSDELNLDDLDNCEEPPPPWLRHTKKYAPPEGVPTLQELCCHVLAQHMHELCDLDWLPEHLADTVRAAIQRDRRLISDGGLGIWLGAVSRGGSTTRLTLRWASSLTDVGLRVLATQDFAEWASRLVELDLAYCELIGDNGVNAVAPCLNSLRALVLTGCTRCGDKSCEAIGMYIRTIERLELELLMGVTDVGVQAIVRGCSKTLTDLRVGGCSKVTSVSTDLIADHCRGTLRRLGLGGLSTLNDIDCESLGRCLGLASLELCACPRISDAGIKQLGMMAAKQMKAYTQWEQVNSGGGILKGKAPPPATLTHLDLGGLQRLSDTALQKLLVRTTHLSELDLRGCSKLTPDGLATVFAGMTAQGVQASASLPVPELRVLTLSSVDAATERVVELIADARPALKLVR